MNQKLKTQSSKQTIKSYNPSEIEAKWQKKWEEAGVYKPDLDQAKRPFYNLMMFPYPSAEGMHVGNMYAFTGADVYGRFKRMQGFDVFEPIGLDGFGIHSENYAIKAGKHPASQAKISEIKFYRQLHSIGNSFDWTRTVETYKPDYYKWTQWLFTALFKAGLAYRKKAPVNFCPSCKTVLADEQVIQKVKSQKSKVEETVAVCERCETEVEKKELEQWFFRITKYADRLLANIAKLDWTEKVKIAQRQWIGKSEGAKVIFSIEGKYHFVLLHGFTGNPEAIFFPWLKRELEKRGHTVEVPLLPNTNNPDINEQARFVLNNCRFNSNTVVLGHSLGSVVAAKVCETLNAPIKKLVLVAGFLQPKFLDKKRPFEETFTWKFDFSKIKKNTSEIVILRATNDTAVPQERSEYIQSVLGGDIIDFEAEDDHITGEKEPVVMTNMSPSISVFTTRPDTLYGATFLVLSPEHPFVQTIDRADVQRYVLEAKKKTEQERIAEGKDPSTGHSTLRDEPSGSDSKSSGQGKTGVFTNFYAINPINQEKLPVWIADYAVMGYGTGALFGDAHDERDVAFAKKYGIPLKPTLITGDKERDRRIMNLEECFTGYGILIDSGKFSGLTSEEAKKKITVWLKEHESGGPEITYHLRDWLISRQRYWGPPIPMVYCEDCAEKGNSWFTSTKKSAFADGLVGPTDLLNDRLDNLRGNITQERRDVNSQFTKGMDSPRVEPGRPGLSSRSSKPAEPMPELVYKSDNELVNNWNSAGWFPVPEEDLPVLLPDVKDWKPKGTGKSPLASAESFVNTSCPNCKSPGKRETDVSDTFLDSSWYFLKYLATDRDDAPFPSEEFARGPVAGFPPATARSEFSFGKNSLRGVGIPSSRTTPRSILPKRSRWLPVSMYIGGAEHSVLHLLYSRFITMVLKDLGFIEFEEPFTRFYAHGLIIKDGAKMSKSKGNVVVPDEYIRKFGADTLRTYLMFMGPFSQGGDFRDTGIEGMHRFLKRIWSLINKHIGTMEDPSGKSFVGSNTAFVVMSRTIRKVTDDLSELSYNTAIAALMEYYNFLAKQKVVLKEELRMLTRLIAPFMPHIAEEIWEKLGENFSVHKEEWPKVSEAALTPYEAIIVVEINGNKRDILKVTMRASKDQKIIEQIAKESANIKKYLEGKRIKKVIYVEGKVVNFVVEL